MLTHSPHAAHVCRSVVETSTSTTWRRSVRRRRSWSERTSSVSRLWSATWLICPPWRTTRARTSRCFISSLIIPVCWVESFEFIRCEHAFTFFSITARGGRTAGSPTTGEGERTGGLSGDNTVTATGKRRTAGGAETQGERPADHHYRVRAGACGRQQWAQWACLFSSHGAHKETVVPLYNGSRVVFIFTPFSMQQRVQQGLEDGARLPSLDIEKLRVENSALREEQQRLKKVRLSL